MLLIFSVITLNISIMAAKPYESNMFRRTENLSRCEKNTEVDITCQKCAKITKSNVVYPMCCTDKEDAYRWCYKYINFGLQKRSQWDHTKSRNNFFSKHHMMQYADEEHNMDISTNYV